MVNSTVWTLTQTMHRLTLVVLMSVCFAANAHAEAASSTGAASNDIEEVVVQGQQLDAQEPLGFYLDAELVISGQFLGYKL